MFMFKSWKCIICFFIQWISILNCNNPIDELTRVETYNTGYIETIHDKGTLLAMPDDVIHARTIKLNELKCGFLFIVKLHMHMIRNLYECPYRNLEPYAPLEVVLFTEEIVKIINIMLNENYWQINEFWLINFYAYASESYYNRAKKSTYVPSHKILEVHDFVFDEITKYLKCNCDRKNVFNFEYEGNQLATKYPSVLKKNAHTSVPIEAFALRRNKKMIHDIIENINTSREKTNKDTSMKFFNKILYFYRTGTDKSDKWACDKIIEQYFTPDTRHEVSVNIIKLINRADKPDLSGLMSLGKLQRAVIDMVKILILQTQWRFVLILNRLLEDKIINSKEDFQRHADKFLHTLTQLINSMGLNDDPLSVNSLISIKYDDFFNIDKRNTPSNHIINSIKHKLRTLSNTYGYKFVDESLDEKIMDGQSTLNFLINLKEDVTLRLGDQFELQCVQSFAKMVDYYTKNIEL